MLGVGDSILTYVRKWVNAILWKGSNVYGYGTQEVYSEIDTAKAVEEGFLKNTAVYSIVMMDAEKFGSIPRYLYDSSKMEEKAIRKKNTLDNDLTRLLNRPNDSESQDAFFTKVRAYYKVCGEAFIWLNRGEIDPQLDDDVVKKMPVLEMYVLPSNHMIVVPDDDFFNVAGYTMDVAGQKIPFRKSEVIHWKNVNMKFDSFSKPQLRGLPPLSPGYATLQQNIDATNASVRMHQNDGSKAIIFDKARTNLGVDQLARIDDIIDAKINNTGKKGAVVRMQGDWGIVNLASSIDQNLIASKELTWKEMCFLLSVPYEFFDSHTPFAEKQLTQQGWVTNKIIPASKQLDGELNRVLLKAFGLEGRAFIACDYWDMPEMQEVRKNAAEGLMKLWPVYPNEVREAIGYEPHPDPTFDEPWVPMGYVPLSQKISDDEGEDIMNELLKDQNIKPASNGNTNGQYRRNGYEKVSKE